MIFNKCQSAQKSPTLTLKKLSNGKIFVVKLHGKQHQATLNDRAKSYSPCRLGCYLCVMASDQIDKKCHIMLVLSGPSLSLCKSYLFKYYKHLFYFLATTYNWFYLFSFLHSQKVLQVLNAKISRLAIFSLLC